jgi:hypothetical protein
MAIKCLIHLSHSAGSEKLLYAKTAEKQITRLKHSSRFLGCGRAGLQERGFEELARMIVFEKKTPNLKFDEFRAGDSLPQVPLAIPLIDLK